MLKDAFTLQMHHKGESMIYRTTQLHQWHRRYYQDQSPKNEISQHEDKICAKITIKLLLRRNLSQILRMF